MSSATTGIDYSIVICTYNPDERLLKRCLNAVYALDVTAVNREVILVDNNSTVPLDTVPYIQEYLARIPEMQIITAKEQGLTFARMAGIEKAKGNYVLFFDDDNDPDHNYLQELKRLNSQYPQVAAWGPGNVWVDFTDGVDEKIKPLAMPVFQERHDGKITYASERSWQSCYPYGTGLCLEITLLKEYIAGVKQGKFTLSDRKGNQMSSGGDTQMVLFCISKGAAAGVSPELKIKHMIPGKRANLAYLKRLVYGTSICYDICALQVFPEYLDDLQARTISGAKFRRKIVKKYLKTLLQNNPQKTLDLIVYIGAVSGNFIALGKPIPQAAFSVLKLLKAI